MKEYLIPTKEGEFFKKYESVPGRFYVSNKGKVFNLSSGRLLKTSVDKYGYERISIIVGSRTDKSRKHLNLKVHQMVAETFLGKPTVNHKDNNKLNNSIENLEWCSASDNLKKGWLSGLFKRSGMNGRKHTEESKRKMSEARKSWYSKFGI